MKWRWKNFQMQVALDTVEVGSAKLKFLDPFNDINQLGSDSELQLPQSSILFVQILGY